MSPVHREAVLMRGLTCRAHPPPSPCLWMRSGPALRIRGGPPAPWKRACPDTSMPTAGSIYKPKLASMHLSRAMEPS